MRKNCQFKKGDRLQVMVGRSFKAVGTFKKYDPKKQMVLIDRVNLQIKHQKPDPNRGIKGGRENIEAPVHVSNVALVCPKCMLPTRIGHEILKKTDDSDSPNKVRVCRRCKAQIDN
ncbi:MAG: 50S ribosomal protein L24 [Deltaproteobacteria bacterium]|jgi:large subunit ribosomal protein L24|nr:50S ribosomal protein L24 [Deltaproteobacteria bacterium]